jgi:hypothetical protein
METDTIPTNPSKKLQLNPMFMFADEGLDVVAEAELPVLVAVPVLPPALDGEATLLLLAAS